MADSNDHGHLKVAAAKPGQQPNPKPNPNKLKSTHNDLTQAEKELRKELPQNKE